jgi:hypothetical protein
MITEKQEQIENGIELLRSTENYLSCQEPFNKSACELLAKLRSELQVEWEKDESTV